MAIVKIVITPIDKEGGPRQSDFRWRAIYQRKSDKMWVYLEHNEVKTAKQPTGASGDLFVINKGSIRELEIDDQAPNYAAYVEFWKRCPKAKVKGEINPDLVFADFEVAVDVDVLRLQFEEIAEKRQAMNRLWDMEYKDLRDTSFAIGTNPTGLAHSSLLATLIGKNFDGDALIKRVNIKKNNKEFQVLAVNHYKDKDREEREFIAKIHKAIRFNIIEYVNSTYKCLDVNLGETPEKVITYFQNNLDFFHNHIETNVWEMDKWGEGMDDIKEATKVSQYKMEVQKKKEAVEAKKKTGTEPLSDLPDLNLSDEDLAGIGASEASKPVPGKFSPPKPKM